MPEGRCQFLRTAALCAALLCSSQVAAAAQLTWSYSGLITHTDVPLEFPLGAPVRLEITVDPDLQALISATVTFNGLSYSVAGPRLVGSVGSIDDHFVYYTSGPATGPTVGDFTPWFATFFFKSPFGPLFTADPFVWGQSFVFEDFFGASIGASGLTLDTPTDLLSALIDDVIALDLGTGITNSLVKKLQAALAASSDESGNNDVAAANVITAFIHQVEAQRGKRLTDAEATFLVESAKAIILALGD